MLLRKTALLLTILIAGRAFALPPNKPITTQLTDQGFECYVRKDYKGAADYFGQVVSMNPEDDNVRYYLTYSLYHAGNYQEALKHAKLLEQYYPEKTEYKILTQNIAERLKEEKPYLGIKPKKYEIVKEVMFGGYESAYNPLKIKEKDKKEEKAVVSKNIAENKKEESKDRINSKEAKVIKQTAETVLTPTPQNAEKKKNSDDFKTASDIHTIRLNKAISFIDEDDFENATKILKELIKDNPKDSDALHQLGYVHYLQNEFNEAIPFLNDSIKHNPKNTECLYLRGNTFKNIGDYNKAIEDYKRVLSIQNDNNTMVKLGEVYLNLGMLNEAETLYNDMLYINPNSEDAKLNIALIKILQGETYDANEIIEEISKNNNSEDMQYIQALSMFSSDDPQYDEIIAKLDSILKDNPSSNKSLILKAKCIIKNNDINKGLDILNSVLETDTNNVDARLALVETYISTETYDEALFNLGETEKVSQIPDTLLYHGLIEAKKKNFESADKYYNEYLEKGKGLAKTYFEYAKYLTMKNDKDNALFYYKKIMNEFRNSEMALKAQQAIFMLNYKE